jgi:ATP-dependent protease ClpP protease subunit
MSNGQQTAEQPVTDVYCLFAGAIDQLAVQRFNNLIAITTQGGAKHIHMLFQSTGGFIGDGVCIYNLFHACPIELTLYNVGSVCSAGVIAYLGAENRKISQYATFMVHRSYISPAMATTERLSSAAGQMTLDDERVESILKLHTKLPTEKWEAHKFADVWLSAKEAETAGIGTIGEFAVPLGTKLFNVWPA